MAKKRWFGFGGSFLILLGWLPSCGSDAPCQGAETCACYANDTCNAGLACRSKTCVDLDGPSSSGGGSGVDTKACLACGDKNCVDEAAACKAASDCTSSLSCFLNCGSDSGCAANCGKSLSVDSGTKAVSYYSCAITKCLSDCVYVPGTGGSGNPGGGASSTAGNGGDHGGAGSSVAGTGASSGGPSNTDLTSGTNWLELLDDGAPPDLGLNAKLGINGVLYAYGDGCATMTWDASSRCLNGELCLTSAANWGVAVGFDFNNSGATGTPANTKHAWNANTYGVVGLAWDTASALPNGFQVWVQNMDPSYNGSCSAMSCDIAGPGDGTASASPSGEFSFATMQKDDWGGSGVPYAFNAANISALQFKVKSAIVPDDTSYRICVRSIGVVR
ncbi:MAG: hypothetical protein ABW061_00255 [Polyangiaceae bacterium]